MQERWVRTEDLRIVARKRKWVPAWLWINIIAFYKLYEIWPLGWMCCCIRNW
jgi:hypothetical protein